VLFDLSVGLALDQHPSDLRPHLTRSVRGRVGKALGLTNGAAELLQERVVARLELRVGELCRIDGVHRHRREDDYCGEKRREEREHYSGFPCPRPRWRGGRHAPGAWRYESLQ